MTNAFQIKIILTFRIGSKLIVHVNNVTEAVCVACTQLLIALEIRCVVVRRSDVKHKFMFCDFKVSTSNFSRMYQTIPIESSIYLIKFVRITNILHLEQRNKQKTNYSIFKYSFSNYLQWKAGGRKCTHGEWKLGKLLTTEKLFSELSAPDKIEDVWQSEVPKSQADLTSYFHVSVFCIWDDNNPLD
jgi:hypothetical protein